MPQSQLPPLASSPDAHTLPRILGPIDAIAIVMGSIIGSGIFLKVDTIAGHLGSFGPIIAVWIAGGVAALCGSLAIAELSAMLPHAGGPYVYLRQAYGRLPAFLWGWVEFSVIRTGSMGSLACASVIYFNRFLEALERQGTLSGPLAEFVPLSHWGQGTLTLLAVASLSFVNIIGTRWAARMQNVTTLIKVSFLGFLILGPFLLGKASSSNLQPILPADLGIDFWKAFGLAMVAVFWPYDGWINIAPVAEEIREPQRNVLLGLGVGMLAIITIYVGTNFGYHSVLTMTQVQTTSAVAADAMGVMIGSWGAAIASAGVMISTFGALNSNLLCGPRIYFAMARDGLFPKVISHVHATFRTPVAAILAQAVWSLLQIVVVFALVADPKGAFDKLTDFVVLGGTAFYGLTVTAVFVLRWKMPGAERPYKTWGYPLTPLVYLASVAVVVVSLLLSDILQVVAVCGLLVIGMIVYWFFRRLEAKNGIG
jgi:amino acid transporter